jgi:hypothetical protein
VTTTPPRLKRIPIPSPNYSSRGGQRVRLIVLHTAEGARTYQSLGAFFRGNVQASSHVGIDDTAGTIGEYVRRSDKAWTCAAYNAMSVNVELCAFAAWTPAEWSNHKTMLDNCSRWIAEEAAVFGIPIVKLTASQAQGGSAGVCQHVDLGAAGGGHHDCGPGFPMDSVLAAAKQYATGQPAPEPKPPAAEEVEMIASAVADNGSLHTFMVGPQRQAVWYTWQQQGQSAWNGGQAGQQVAKMTKFADAPNGRTIRGIAAETNSAGVLHVFVTLDDGSTVYTWQPKGKTAWNGSGPGKVAGLTAFAPKP